ncbi:hypothetical protein CKAH01_11177 [Colletotrichum kahawae]|uniref:Uncharacterized protein n=1 Tax=Colletotrichum kahawae TaxID=34407 RepID=A0AAE0CWI9_COLKA|nr:hypothetical protein CKAH01_11177 [Colletotrichum kahawae]
MNLHQSLFASCRRRRPCWRLRLAAAERTVPVSAVRTGWDGRTERRGTKVGKGARRRGRGSRGCSQCMRILDEWTRTQATLDGETRMTAQCWFLPLAHRWRWHLQESAAVRYGMACVACSFCRVSGLWGSQWSLVSLGDRGHSFGFLLGGSDHILRNSTMGTNKQMLLKKKIATAHSTAIRQCI